MTVYADSRLLLEGIQDNNGYLDFPLSTQQTVYDVQYYWSKNKIMQPIFQYMQKENSS